MSDSAGDDFGGDESVVFRLRPETSVYLNEHGDLVIRQKNWPNEDEFIYIEARDVPLLIERMMQVISETWAES